MPLRKIAVYTASLALVTILFAVGFLACEAAFRAMDGYKVLSLRLIRVAPSDVSSAKSARASARSVPLAPGMVREWFDLSPPPLPRESNSILVEIARKFEHTDLGFELFHVFNARFARQRLCADQFFNRLPGFLFLYDPHVESEYPRYRFPLNTVTPQGLVTNQFGWRGRQVELRKPANTIRIAFVGASTTVNDHSFPFSYPELAGFWLNKWAQETFGVQVEAINAGREGIGSFDIAAVVRDELLALEPDLVVYYEGGNQFGLDGILRIKGEPGPPPVAPQRNVTELENYSAFARRATQLVAALSESHAEPAKPSYDVMWPADVEEMDPPLTHPALPVNLSTIVADLDRIRTSVAATGGELAVSSFFWLVHDGMKLDPVRNHGIYWYLNAKLFPYKYRDVERLAAFQNRVLKKYAADRQVPFLDIAAAMPRDPDLFVDPVHATYEGVKLHAWIVAQKLVPLLHERISQRRLPRPFQSDLASHPAFPGNERTAVFACSPDMGKLVRVAQLDLTRDVRIVAPASVTLGQGLTIRIPAGTETYRYAAVVESPWSSEKREGGYVLKAQIKVSGGEAGIGILSADEKIFHAQQSVKETGEFVPVHLAYFGEDVGPVVIAAGGTVPSQEVTVEVRDAELSAFEGTRYQLTTHAPGLAHPPAQLRH